MEYRTRCCLIVLVLMMGFSPPVFAASASAKIVVTYGGLNERRGSFCRKRRGDFPEARA